MFSKHFGALGNLAGTLTILSGFKEVERLFACIVDVFDGFFLDYHQDSYS